MSAYSSNLLEENRWIRSAEVLGIPSILAGVRKSAPTGCHVDLTELARSIRLAPALHTRYLGYACETRHSNTTKYHIEEELRYVHHSVGVEQPSDKRMVVKLSTIRRKLA